MIWEVDENLDEHVDWNEFRTMYQRNVLDKTGGFAVDVTKSLVLFIPDYEYGITTRYRA